MRASLLVIALILAGCSALTNQAAGVDYPPAGTIWFGTSFDATTLELRGRTDTISAQAPFSAVAHLTTATEGSKMNMRIYLDNALITTTGLSWNGSSDLWGWSPGPMYQPGDWRYELVDIGGNILAAGQIRGT